MSEKLTYNQILEQDTKGLPTVLVERTDKIIQTGYYRVDKDGKGRVYFKGPNGEHLSKGATREAVSDFNQERLARELAGKALRGEVVVDPDESSDDSLGDDLFPGMFDPNYSSGLSKQEMIERAAVRVPLTDGERLARQREADDREAAARDAYKRPEMNG